MERVKIQTRPKAVAQDYSPPSFFFKEHRKQGARFLVWTSQLPQLKLIFYHLLKKFPEEVEVLLKITDDGMDPKKWQRFYGVLHRSNLQKIILSNERFIFQDGGEQLSIKNPSTDEYITLDEHGILYVYSNSPVFAELFIRYGFEERKEKLISDLNHWHIFPAAAERLRSKLINALNLKKIEEGRRNVRRDAASRGFHQGRTRETGKGGGMK